MNSLDLRFNGRLDADASSIFNRISNEKRESFNDIVSILSEPHINNIDWWVEGPASRNTYSSPFFHRYCCFFLLDKLTDADNFRYSEIIVDSKEFAIILQQLLSDKGQHQPVIHVRHIKSFFQRKIKRALVFPALFFKVSIRFLVTRITRHLTVHKLPGTPVVLIDTFVLPEYTDKDRWYGSLWSNLSADQKREVFFVPSIVMTSITAFFRVYKNLRNDQRNFLIKEDYLRPGDIFWAFGIRRRLKKLFIGPLQVSGYDFSGIIKNELLNTTDVLTVVDSLLTYRFIKRLSEKKIRVRLSIDWFEGQVLDKAWNLAFKRYFPEVKRIGFRGCGNFSLYLCSFPTAFERMAGVIPDSFAVPGKGLISAVSEFLQDADVIVVPAFRTQHVWENSFINPDGKSSDQIFIILITFPIDVKITNKIIRLLLEAFPGVNCETKKVQYILKIHPACPIDDEYNRLISALPESFLLTDEKSFSKLIGQANLLISEASGTCLEALACGVPVVVIHNNEGLTYDPIPVSIPDQLYMNVISAEELAFAIDFYINSSSNKKEEQRSQGKWVKENYFEPLTGEGINKLINIQKT